MTPASADRLLKSVRLWIQKSVATLQKFAERVWYPPFIGLLAGLDNFILVIPNDGILISSCILTPKRWFTLAINVAIGSTLGAMALAALVEYQGLPWLLEMYPGIDQSSTWIWAEKLFANYGLLFVFLVAASPLMQQPSVFLAALAKTNLLTLAIVIFTGRTLKFLLMAYIGSHAPNLLNKLWGVRGEMRDVGLKIK